MRKPEYLTNEQFVVIWMKHAVAGGDLSDVVAEVAKVCEESGRPAMPAASVAAKASYLRAQGLRLPKLKVGAKPAGEFERLSALITKIANGAEVPVSDLKKLPDVPRIEFPSEGDPRPIIREVIAEIKSQL